MRTTVDLESRLLKRIRDEALRRGVSFKHLLNEALRRGLAEPAARLEPYRCPVVSLGAPRAGLDLDKALALAGMLEDEEVVQELARRR